MKGGAAGGGHAQVVPMEDINLHFTGDFHAIELANNLLAAMLDNHIHHGNALGIDVRRIVWKRVVDMNDRALRKIVVGLGGAGNAVPREDGFDITVASEVMAIFCLATILAELKERLGRIVVGYTTSKPILRRDLKAHGAMTALLQGCARSRTWCRRWRTIPAFIHGGPFANIAHGCNSVIATRPPCSWPTTWSPRRLRRRPGRREVFDIKCRKAGLTRRRGRGGHRAVRSSITAACELADAARRTGGPGEGHREPRAPHRQRARDYGLPCGRGREPSRRGHATPRQVLIRDVLALRRESHSCRALAPAGGKGRWEWPRPSEEIADRRHIKFLYEIRQSSLWDKMGHHRRRSRGPRGGRRQTPREVPAA